MSSTGKIGAGKIEDVLLLYGGDLSSDVAEQITRKISPFIDATHVHHTSMSKSKEFKAALLESTDTLAKPTTLAIFVLQTIENEAPPEDAGACIRFFKRKVSTI